jgi:hypothetical protein
LDRARQLFTNALQQHRSGQLAEAERLYRSVLAIDPTHAQSHYLIGVIALQLGRPQHAIEAIHDAMALNEPVAEWHYNLAFAYQSVRRLDDAVAHYHRAITLEPAHAAAQVNLARTLLALGKVESALSVATRALKIVPSPDIQRLMVECLTNLRGVAAGPELRDVVLRAATEDWGNLADFAHVAAALLDSAVIAMVRRAADAWPELLPADTLLGSDGIRALAEDRLLHSLLTTVIIWSRELERFITCLRSVVLDWAEHCERDETAVRQTVEIGCLLAQQCFINDYVYVQREDEVQRVVHLKARLAAALQGCEPAPSIWLAAVAAYQPLHGIAGAELLLRRPWPDAMRQLLQQQVEEPQEEAIASIPQLTLLDDGVSTRVGRQYEESPYPRWVRAVPPPGRSASTRICARSFPRLRCGSSARSTSSTS